MIVMLQSGLPGYLQQTYQHMFQLPLPVLEKLVRPVIVYLTLVILLRLFGKRELAQLNPFDLVVLLFKLEQHARGFFAAVERFVHRPEGIREPPRRIVFQHLAFNNQLALAPTARKAETVV